ncbi:hypothetical protein FC36_GL001429 [Ligilactobacillus equi DSM 15833 = JCM 10991]|nr:hypothetical protein FC36_GL001429 [Ligilactobacillus equi DSM 15833 = JCM 10991]
MNVIGSQKIDELKSLQINNDFMKLVSQGKDITDLYQKYSEEELTNIGIRIHKSSDRKD